jgi:hypothetical protein
MANSLARLLQGGVKGLPVGVGIQQRQSALKLQQQKQAQTEQQQQREQGQKLVDDAFLRADEAMKGAYKRADLIEDPILKNIEIDNAKKLTSILEKSVEKTNSIIGGNPQSFAARFSNIREQPDIEGERKLAARAKGAVAGAQERAKQEVRKDFPGAGALIVLEKEGDRITLRQKDPKVDELIKQGYQKAVTPTVSSEIILPILQKQLQGIELTENERTAMDEAKSIGLIDQIIRSAVGGNPLSTQGASFTDEETFLQQAREALASGRDEGQIKAKLRSMNIDPNRL